MWDDLRCLNRDFDIAKANKFYLKHLRKMRKEYPHLPESLAKKLDLWERHFMGDFAATKEVLILRRKRGFSPIESLLRTGDQALKNKF